MTRQPALHDVPQMPVRDLIALPTEELVRLRRDARTALEAAVRLEQWLYGIARIKGVA